MEKRILAKCGRKKAKCGRKKAALGSETAAIITASLTNAAATAAAATVGANATKDAANKQAQATTAAAQKQAQAIKTQTESSKEYQLQAQNFVKEQNAESRELQKDIQMQLQMLTGQQNVNDRLETSKLVVKNGGVRKPRYSLRGNNTNFKVTDGGYMLYRGSTPEGFNLFEARGNDHEHYHKTPSGKYKTGVGIELKDKSVIELEGNQKTKQGEYLLQTPWALYAISKHTIDGFNPVKAVNEGIHPLLAFEKQEVKKKIKGVNDDGTPIGSPVKDHKAYAGTLIPTVLNMYNQITPKLETDTVGDTTVGVAYASQNKNQMKCGGKKRTLKCGGKVRKKAYDGFEHWFSNPNYSTLSDVTIVNPSAGTTVNWGTGNITLPSNTIVTSNTTTNTTKPVTTKSSGSFWNNIGADLIGAGLSSLGNIGGAWITSNANRYAANKLAEAHNTSAGIMADAYNSIEGIDLSSIKEKDFSTAHVMPALQAPIDRSASQIALVGRQLQRRLSNAGKYSVSKASAQDREAKAEVDAQDAKNNIYSLNREQTQKILNENANRITQAAIQNAQLDMEAKNRYISAYYDALKYNAETKKEKILGAAGALSEGALNAAGVIANARTANASSYNEAITKSGQGFANTLSAMATRKADLKKVMLGASGDTRSLYYANNGSYGDAKNYYNNLVRQYDLIKNSTKPEDQDNKTYLKRLINIVATGRNFDTV